MGVSDLSFGVAAFGVCDCDRPPGVTRAGDELAVVFGVRDRPLTPDALGVDFGVFAATGVAAFLPGVATFGVALFGVALLLLEALFLADDNFGVAL